MTSTTALTTAVGLQHTPARTLAAAQCGAGTVLLTRPRSVASAVSGQGAQPAAWLVQLLGARLLIQGVVLLLRPSRRTALAGAAVDAAHCLSMLAAAEVSRPHRRAALISAVAAAASALAAVRLPIAASRVRA
ncbi:hypothetical protein [Jatrophihabitans lederbergiae]|uniref:Uncharacterized protein n=1 Tax=Jatrophihabitans lederbergiae TaxID=3075547 RepID=A0ABU2JFE1_9ACTN|nr:hypothetical protein [Jatrophihabitans sp. DSM 44399]MDT0263696.1 hypothetical protein [Jatrophihabitans sp. DSM 44399]